MVFQLTIYATDLTVFLFKGEMQTVNSEVFVAGTCWWLSKEKVTVSLVWYGHCPTFGRYKYNICQSLNLVMLMITDLFIIWWVGSTTTLSEIQWTAPPLTLWKKIIVETVCRCVCLDVCSNPWSQVPGLRYLHTAIVSSDFEGNMSSGWHDLNPDSRSI